MTREEAIEYAESKKMRLEALAYNDDCKYGNYAMYSGELSFVNAALTALRTPTREMVEKVFPGCVLCKWGGLDCVGVDGDGIYLSKPPKDEKVRFCPVCGKPLTDEAVDMMLERMEGAIDGEATTD